MTPVAPKRGLQEKQVKQTTHTKHTPGPWEPVLMSDDSKRWGVTAKTICGNPSRIITCEHDGPYVHDEENPYRAAEFTPDPEISKANARLIAAAPDLLEAAREFVRKVEGGEARSTRSYAAFKAAIAKATGGQS